MLHGTHPQLLGATGVHLRDGPPATKTGGQATVGSARSSTCVGSSNSYPSIPWDPLGSLAGYGKLKSYPGDFHQRLLPGLTAANVASTRLGGGELDGIGRFQTLEMKLQVISSMRIKMHKTC